MVSSLRRFADDEVAQERLRIIKFYDKHGEAATREAFGVGRGTICVWKKRLIRGRHHLSCLIPSSTRPRRVRGMTTGPQVLEYIRELREKYPGLGKEKIKPLLDHYCQSEGISSLGVSTIGKVIKRNNLFFRRTGRIYHRPSKAYLQGSRPKRQRVRFAPKPKEFGYIQMDTVLKLSEGVRLYVYSAIDIHGKLVLSLPYPSLNSTNTLDFFKKFQELLPYPIKSVQTDNGLEFLGLFDDYLRRVGISHLFIYPRCPRINGVIERYQRTLQEEFLDQNLDLLEDPREFSLKLTNYLLFFLTERVHKSLGNQTPVDYLIAKGGMSKKSVTHTLS